MRSLNFIFMLNANGWGMDMFFMFHLRFECQWLKTQQCFMRHLHFRCCCLKNSHFPCCVNSMLGGDYWKSRMRLMIFITCSMLLVRVSKFHDCCTSMWSICILDVDVWKTHMFHTALIACWMVIIEQLTCAWCSYYMLNVAGQKI